MRSLSPDALARMRFNAQQMATPRTLGEYQGKQRLYVAQAPEIVTGLRQVAVVESTKSSNRLEGVVVAPSRLKLLVLKNAAPKSRSEQEVAGYRDALALIHESATHTPFSEGTVLQLHGMLYRYMPPGQYRRIPVWIGSDRHDQSKARYLPIDAGDLPASMGEWEKHLHADEPDQLVQLAVIHAEFESLHPFLDGNGRVGRMLVPLFLWQRQLIRAPLFYVSAYFETHRGAYYDGLLSVSRDRDWTGWCRYFLQALRTQAQSNYATASAILELHGQLGRDAVQWTRSQYAVQALDWMFGRPIFKSTDFVANAGIPAPTAKRLLAVFREHGVFSVLTEGRGRRPAVYALRQPLNVAEGAEVFR